MNCLFVTKKPKLKEITCNHPKNVGICAQEKMGASWCSFTKNDLNNASILDRVISQASSEDECLLYRLANYKKSGELIDAYTSGGQAKVEKFIREQFSTFMYNDGKGQVINRSEYLRWRFRNQNQVSTSTTNPIRIKSCLYSSKKYWSMVCSIPLWATCDPYSCFL